MSNSPDDNSALIPSEVRDLIEESRTVQAWLDRLASHESDASPEVFKRVCKDYEGRLESATTRLARHRSELANNLEARRTELETLQADRDSQAADLEEARLRHMVGEFSDDQWSEVSESIEGSLAELSELLEMEEGSVGELAAIVASIDEGRLPTAAPEPAVAARPAAEEPVAEEPDDGDEGIAAEDAQDEPKPAIVDEAESAEKAAADDDTQIADAESAAGDDPVDDPTGAVPEETAEEITVEATDHGPDGAPPADAVSAVSAISEEDGDEGGDYLDELEFLESLSLDESDRFDAVSAMLDEDEPEKKK